MTQIATITVASPRPSRYSDTDGAIDHAVTIVVAGRTIEGGITLHPDAINGGYSAWGGTIDTWCSDTIVSWLHTLTDRSVREVCRSLKGGEGTDDIEVEIKAQENAEEGP